MTPRRLAGSLAAALVAGGLLAGCGQSTSPGEADPALKAGLDQVDAAIAAGNLQEARTAAQRLIANTTQSEQNGDISSDEGSRILQAVRALIAQLPAPSLTDTPTAQTTTAAKTKPPHHKTTDHPPAPPHPDGHGPNKDKKDKGPHGPGHP